MTSEKPTLEEYPTIRNDIQRIVELALDEDILDGDITANLIPEDKLAKATIITREDCVVCGLPWVEEVFHQLGCNTKITWHVKDGDFVRAGTTLCSLRGNARILLTGERAALNFLQLLSGTATTSKQFADLVKDHPVKILDTRKTIPGLRTAQKYAVRCGGCYNHRMGLYDAFLIKENHIAACGGIAQAIETAKRQQPGKMVEIEVETIEELKLAIAAHADVIMLDNFTADQLKDANKLKDAQVKYEVSGNIDKTRIESQQFHNIDFISSGAITKNLRAIDLSMLFNTSLNEQTF